MGKTVKVGFELSEAATVRLQEYMEEHNISLQDALLAIVEDHLEDQELRDDLWKELEPQFPLKGMS